jgi:PIN domain nuclease of toxin-antitoxin system
VDELVDRLVRCLTLPPTFRGDPADRLIYATAVEHGWSLVTKDERIRGDGQARRLTVW